MQVHPHEAGRDWGPETRAEIRRLAESDRCVAIGECGLDFNRDFSPRDAQEACFEDQAGELPVLMLCACRHDCLLVCIWNSVDACAGTNGV